MLTSLDTLYLARGCELLRINIYRTYLSCDFLCSLLRWGLKVQDIVRGLKSEQIYPKYSKNLLSNFPACINLLLFRRTCYYLPRILSNLLGSSPFKHLIPIIFPFFLSSSFFFSFRQTKRIILIPLANVQNSRAFEFEGAHRS